MGKCAFRSPDGRRCERSGSHQGTHEVENFTPRPDRSPGHWEQPDWDQEPAATYGGWPQTEGTDWDG